MRSLALGILGAVGVVTVAPLASANLLANGSFEIPGLAAGAGFANFPVGTAGLTGWTIIGPAGTAVSIVSGSFTQNGVSFPAEDGVQWLDLTGDNSNSTEGVSQLVATTIGDEYQLSFYIGNTTGGQIFGTTSTVDVLLDGSLAFANTNAMASPTTLIWLQYTHTFIASGATTTIGFQNADPSTDNSNGLDNVVLTDLGPAGPAPEPATLALLGLGLAGLGFSRRK
jgi:hypothetical protein